jgi:hypothetical protein
MVGPPTQLFKITLFEPRGGVTRREGRGEKGEERGYGRLGMGGRGVAVEGRGMEWSQYG